MLSAIIWRDLRWRMLAAAVPVLAPAALVAFSYAMQPPRAGGAPAGLAAFLDATWFRLPGPSAVFLLAAVIIGAAGGLLRPRGDVAYLLALPVSRRRWLLAHAALSLGALAALVVLADVVLAAGGVHAGAHVAPLPLLARSLAVLVAAGAWMGLTLGVATLVRHPVLAAVLVLAATTLLPPDRFRLDIPADVTPPPLLPRWDPWALADPRAWAGGIPLPSLLTAFALGAAGLLVALYRLERFEP